MEETSTEKLVAWKIRKSDNGLRSKYSLWLHFYNNYKQTSTFEIVKYTLYFWINKEHYCDVTDKIISKCLEILDK